MDEPRPPHDEGIVAIEDERSPTLGALNHIQDNAHGSIGALGWSKPPLTVAAHAAVCAIAGIRVR